MVNMSMMMNTMMRKMTITVKKQLKQLNQINNLWQVIQQINRDDLVSEQIKFENEMTISDKLKIMSFQRLTNKY